MLRRIAGGGCGGGAERSRAPRERRRRGCPRGGRTPGGLRGRSGHEADGETDRHRVTEQRSRDRRGSTMPHEIRGLERLPRTKRGVGTGAWERGRRRRRSWRAPRRLAGDSALSSAGRRAPDRSGGRRQAEQPTTPAAVVKACGAAAGRKPPGEGGLSACCVLHTARRNSLGGYAPPMHSVRAPDCDAIQTAHLSSHNGARRPQRDAVVPFTWLDSCLYAPHLSEPARSRRPHV